MTKVEAVTNLINSIYPTEIWPMGHVGLTVVFFILVIIGCCLGAAFISCLFEYLHKMKTTMWESIDHEGYVLGVVMSFCLTFIVFGFAGKALARGIRDDFNKKTARLQSLVKHDNAWAYYQYDLDAHDAIKNMIDAMTLKDKVETEHSIK